MLTLCQRLGCEVNQEGEGRLIAVIRGLYDGVRETLKPIRIEAATQYCLDHQGAQAQTPGSCSGTAIWATPMAKSAMP